MPQHEPMRQQILMIDPLAARLSVPPSSLSLYFSSKAELVRQLISFIRTRIRQPPLPVSHRSLTGEHQDLLATYRELFITELLDMLLFGIARRAP